MKAKSVLVPSLFLNVVLLVFCGAVVSLRGSRPAATAPAGSESIPAVKLPPGPAPRVAANANAAAERFRWSQLETGDYAAYIANLRAIGCPEGTVRDIVAAAIGHDYDKKREDLQARRGKGELGAVALQDETAKLWSEQNDLLARLFGTQQTFGAGGSVAQAASSGAPGAPLSGAVSPIYGDARTQLLRTNSMETAPLVFADPDPAWGLTPTELDVWSQARESFAEAVAGAGQDPKDPAYHERWQEAKAEADQRLKTLFGFEKFSKWQSLSQSQMPPPPATK